MHAQVLEAAGGKEALVKSQRTNRDLVSSTPEPEFCGATPHNEHGI